MKALSTFACFAVSLASMACTNDKKEVAAQGLSAELAAEIEGICGLPAGAFSGQVPVPDDAMPKLACALKEARKRDVELGFITNPLDPDG